MLHARKALHHEHHRLVHRRLLNVLQIRSRVAQAVAATLDHGLCLRNPHVIQRAGAGQIRAREDSLGSRGVQPDHLSRRRRQLRDVLEGLNLVQLLEALAHSFEGALGIFWRRRQRDNRKLCCNDVCSDRPLSVLRGVDEAELVEVLTAQL